MKKIVIRFVCSHLRNDLSKKPPKPIKRSRYCQYSRSDYMVYTLVGKEQLRQMKTVRAYDMHELIFKLRKLEKEGWKRGAIERVDSIGGTYLGHMYKG